MPDASGWTEADLEAARLREMGAQLAALHAPTEAALLGLGKVVREAHGATKDLAAHATALEARLSGPDFQALLARLDQTVARIGGLTDRPIGGGDEPLSAIIDAARGIERVLAALSQTLTHVHALGMNAKIEAAQFTGAGMDFTLFTHEIARLSARGRQSLAGMADALARLRVAAQEAHAAQGAFERQHRGTLREVAARVAHSASALHDRERRAARTAQTLPRALTECVERIGAVVVALQFGDITRQRLEHVEHGLSDAAGVGEGAPLPPGAGDDRAAFVIAMRDLQSRHLIEIEKEFSSRMAEVLDNLGGLARNIEAIGANTSAVFAAEDGGANVLVAIDAELEAVAVVLDHYTRTVENVAASIGAVLAAMGDMRRAMVFLADIDADMNLIGLNASIKCGNLGVKGRTLNVVAQELRVFARQTKALAGDVLGHLRRIDAAAEIMERAAAEDDVGALAAMERDLRQVVGALEDSGRGTGSSLTEVEKQCAAISACLRDTLAITAHRESSATMRRVHANLTRLVGPTTPDPSLLRYLDERYTMESERRLHQGDGGQTGTADSGEIDDIFF